MTRRRDPQPDPRDEALKAIDSALANLTNRERLTGLSIALLTSTLEYAREQVGLIQSLKRRRSVPSDGASRG